MKHVVSLRMPKKMKEELFKAAEAHNITVTKYVLRALLNVLIKEGYMKEKREDMYIETM